MTNAMTQKQQIAILNDRFRYALGMLCDIPGRLVVTRGVAEIGEEALTEVLVLVRRFNEFTAANDPHGEHDFGAFEHGGKRIFWKIDYYDLEYTDGSEDPTDLEKTERVLTILLADEY